MTTEIKKIKSRMMFVASAVLSDLSYTDVSTSDLSPLSKYTHKTTDYLKTKNKTWTHNNTL